jgi:branched-chain amino acid transport system permease protein
MTIFLQGVINAVSLGSLYALAALGIALIFGVMNFVNFAYGELIMLGGYVLVYLATQSAPVAILVTLAAVALAALAQERVAFRPLRDAPPTTLFIASFAVSFFIQNLVRLTLGSQAKAVPFPTWVLTSVFFHGLFISAVAIAELVATAVLLTSVWIILKKTSIGIQMRAAAEDFVMARLLGVRANRVIALAFALSGVLAGAITVLYLAQIGAVTPTIGLLPVLVGFIATIIGGMGSLVGAALGGFLLGVVTVVLDTALPAHLRPFRDAFLYAVVIAVLLVRPEGLLGRRAVLL